MYFPKPASRQHLCLPQRPQIPPPTHKSFRGSIETTKTRLGPQRVRMSSGDRPTGAAKGKQSDTEALCQPPPPHTHTLSMPVRSNTLGPNEGWVTQWITGLVTAWVTGSVARWVAASVAAPFVRWVDCRLLYYLSWSLGWSLVPSLGQLVCQLRVLHCCGPTCICTAKRPQGECHARSAHAVRSFGCRQILEP